jgi:hypothetical protein
MIDDVSWSYWPVQPRFGRLKSELKKKKGVVGPPNNQLDLVMPFFIFSNENKDGFLPFF